MANGEFGFWKRGQEQKDIKMKKGLRGILKTTETGMVETAAGLVGATIGAALGSLTGTIKEGAAIGAGGARWIAGQAKRGGKNIDKRLEQLSRLYGTASDEQVLMREEYIEEDQAQQLGELTDSLSMAWMAYSFMGAKSGPGKSVRESAEKFGNWAKGGSKEAIASAAKKATMKGTFVATEKATSADLFKEALANKEQKFRTLREGAMPWEEGFITHEGLGPTTLGKAAPQFASAKDIPISGFESTISTGLGETPSIVQAPTNLQEALQMYSAKPQLPLSGEKGVPMPKGWTEEMRGFKLPKGLQSREQYTDIADYVDLPSVEKRSGVPMGLGLGGGETKQTWGEVINQHVDSLTGDAKAEMIKLQKQVEGFGGDITEEAEKVIANRIKEIREIEEMKKEGAKWVFGKRGELVSEEGVEKAVGESFTKRGFERKKAGLDELQKQLDALEGGMVEGHEKQRQALVLKDLEEMKIAEEKASQIKKKTDPLLRTADIESKLAAWEEGQKLTEEGVFTSGEKNQQLLGQIYNMVMSGEKPLPKDWDLKTLIELYGKKKGTKLAERSGLQYDNPFRFHNFPEGW